ncbi:MAG: hypothetical protein HY202_05250 [Nitrospirae bacterium]|nr:hypothetical protein [Nitrospirota bacterium]
MNFGAIQRLRFLIEDRTGRFFKKGENPFYLLGALSFFFFWILLGTGIYLFFVYRLNIDGAYDSIQYLTDHQPWWGGLIRSLHRYASDGLVIAMILFGSGRPAYSFYQKGDSLLVVSLKVTASPLHCRELSQEELERLPEHMRTPLECSRKRWPVNVRLELDGENRLEKKYPPGGLWSDGPAFVYEKFKVKPGIHEIRLVMKESPTAPGLVRMEQIDFQPGRAVVLNLLPVR